MAKIKLGDLATDTISLMVYGPPGSGKTMLPTTLYPDDPYSVGYITSEINGLKTLRSMGFPKDMEFELLSQEEDPFPRIIKVIEEYARNPKIKVICVDGTTGISGVFIDSFTQGEGEKAMGFEGWGEMLTGFRNVDKAGEKARRAGKSIVYTSWLIEPQYETVGHGSQKEQILKSEGGPYIMGKSRIWLPGNCDIVARQKGVVKRDPKTKANVFTSTLELKQSKDWIARTKWDQLPSPCPANLRTIVNLVKKMGGNLTPVAKPQPKVKVG